jgi:OOP family OmpA-OmpF porin
VLYGPAIYRREDFAKGLSMLECAGGVTPMSDGLSVAAGLPKAGADEIALILVSDFLQIDARAVNAAVDKLRAGYDNRLCIHTIRVGKFTESNDLIAALARVDGCGSSVEADALGSPAAVSKYVTDVLLKPAPAAAAIKYEKNTVAASALFAHDKAVLTSEGKAALHKLDESIRAKGATVVDIQVVGHTDNAGTEEHNMGLSMRRAEAVRDYMVSEEVSPSIIRVSGEGETKPVASNATREGRAQNRRVEIIVGIKQPG